MAAAVPLDSVVTSAQRQGRRPQRAAVIHVNHWHSTYDASYLRLLQETGIEIVGVSDSNKAIAEDRAQKFKTRAFTDYRVMLTDSKPDFVIALGRHIDMPATFRHLVDVGIPFLMEKPWGVDAKTVNGLAELAEQKRAWVAVPFPNRYTYWAQRAKAIIRSGELGTVSHVVFRMIRPTMQRYVEWDSPWMLRKAEAGGGALINLGSHGFDLCRFITDEEPKVVAASMSSAVHKTDVEDYALVTLRTPSGILFHNEVGYTMPTWPRNSTDGERKVAAAKALMREVPGGVHYLGADRDETVKTPADFPSGGYIRVIRECFDRLERGDPPPMTASDCAKAVTLIHDAYRIAGSA